MTPRRVLSVATVAVAVSSLAACQTKPVRSEWDVDGHVHLDHHDFFDASA